jgi:Pvc16 N-terminal domain
MNPSALAIAATTATLQGILSEGLGGLNVTIRPLDTARNNTTGDQINLFLYQVLPDAAWRNMDIPRRVRPGETAPPPLPLTLYYLITAFGEDNDNDIKSHALLGKAMSVLHDYPVIGADKIKKNIDSETANLEEQAERVRITLQPLTFEEISKLWTTFQTHYRTSAAYQVSVVLIESTLSSKTPLPVLRRGEEDRGAEVGAGSLPVVEEIRVPMSGAFSALANVRLAKTLPSAQLNDEIAILGRNFSAGGAHVRLKHPLVAAPFELQPTQMDDQTIIVKLPDAAAASATWPAGFYTASVIVSNAGARDRVSNEQVFSLAPAITIPPASAPPGDITLTVTTAPQIRKQQSVSLLFGDQQIQHTALAAATNTLTFNLNAVAAGNYVARLRVDGVDSIPVDRTSQVPKFADDQTLKVS